MINRNSLIECVYFLDLLCRLLTIRVNKARSVALLIANSCSGVQNISLEACPAVRHIGYAQFNFSFNLLNYTPYTVPGACHGTKC